MSSTKRNFNIGLALLITGVIFRVSAKSIAWPSSYSFSGERANTSWAIMEKAISEISMGVFYIGAALIVSSLLVKQVVDLTSCQANEK